MKKIHQKLMERKGAYANWHDSPLHSALHWAMFGIFVVPLAFAFVLSAKGVLPTSLLSLQPASAVARLDEPLVAKPAKGVTATIAVHFDDPSQKPAEQKTEEAKPAAKVVEAAAISGPASPCKSGKCVLVLLNKQKIYAYQDGKIVYTSLVSTGVAGHRTPTGTFKVYGKTRSQKMSGPGYYLPNVPYILWFKGDYSLHGTYWHHNFGHPMSHGCVNLPTPVAKWFFDWAPVGTQITIRAS